MITNSKTEPRNQESGYLWGEGRGGHQEESGGPRLTLTLVVVTQVIVL